MKIELKKRTGLILGVVIFVSIIFGYGVGNILFDSKAVIEVKISTPQTWTCSMHPQIRKDKQGNCPICGMELILVQKESSEEIENEISLSLHAEKLADIQVSPVERNYATELLLLSGKLLVDETRSKTISAWFPGRIENLFIDYTGIKVNKNDHMAVIYSPDLLVAQKELLEAKRSQSYALISSTREKLRLWGLSLSQIKSIEKTGKVSDQLTINAPIGGTVLKKFVSEGDYVQTGSKIYHMADLSRIWLLAEVYEADVGKVTYGQKLSFTTDSYPGEIFEGIVTFVDPVVDPKTRIVRVRAVVENKDKKLKPEMLARVTIEINMGANGVVSSTDYEDYWVGPMHHEEISVKPGNCSICGMKLKRASELGLVIAKDNEMPLLIPATAPLITGKRAVVYVKGNRPGSYEGREIILGHRVGNHYIVKMGLSEGELVVTKGNFKIDSAMQIMAKPSMMQSEASVPMKNHKH